MNIKNFGLLIKKLRTEQKNEDGSNLNQQQLADSAKISIRTLQRIEQGSSGLNHEDLNRISIALGLTYAEKREFFIAAYEAYAGSMDKDKYDDIRVRLINIISESYYPAFIYNQYGDIVSANSSIIRLYNVDNAIILNNSVIDFGLNIMRLVFSDDIGFKKTIGESRWEITAKSNIQLFRAITMRYRTEPYFGVLMKSLLSIKAFREYWHNAYLHEQVYRGSIAEYDYHHVEFGFLSYTAVLSQNYTDGGDLHLTTYMPRTEATKQCFMRLFPEGQRSVDFDKS
jgi:transcriptional regulator with XRE-family HTH domain